MAGSGKGPTGTPTCRQWPLARQQWAFWQLALRGEAWERDTVGGHPTKPAPAPTSRRSFQSEAMRKGNK